MHTCLFAEHVWSQIQPCHVQLWDGRTGLVLGLKSVSNMLFQWPEWSSSIYTGVSNSVGERGALSLGFSSACLPCQGDVCGVDTCPLKNGPRPWHTCHWTAKPADGDGFWSTKPELDLNWWSTSEKICILLLSPSWSMYFHGAKYTANIITQEYELHHLDWYLVPKFKDAG